MKNKQLMENLLKEYSFLKKRTTLIEKLNFDKSFNSDITLSNRAISSSSAECTYENRIHKQNAMILRLVESVEDYENELSNLYKSIEIIDEALNILKLENENYYILIRDHFINKVRIEDLEESFALSRSRCYEMRKRALESLTLIMFGNLLSCSYGTSFRIGSSSFL